MNVLHTNYISPITRFISENLGISTQTQNKIFISLSIMLLFWIIHKLVIHFVIKRVKSTKSLYVWKRGISYSIFIISFVIVLRIWFKGFESLATFVGLVSAGIAIALKDILTSLVGWIFILLRRPFALGDRIEISGISGDVIDIRPFLFTVNEIKNWVDADQSTGRIVQIPNYKIFTEPLHNYTQGFHYIWDEIPVLITFESNWKKAKRILSEIADIFHEKGNFRAEEKLEEASRKYLIYYSNLHPKVYTSVKESGILLTIRYLCEPRKRRGSQEEIWEAVLTHFSQESDITIAYPTLRLYRQESE